MAISSAFIDRLLGNVNIIDIIGRRITLERRGGAYWAKCPFHGSGEERTASFKVYDQTVLIIVLVVKNQEMQFIL